MRIRSRVLWRFGFEAALDLDLLLLRLSQSGRALPHSKTLARPASGLSVCFGLTHSEDIQ
jgi:hypothetical protein